MKGEKKYWIFKMLLFLLLFHTAGLFFRTLLAFYYLDYTYYRFSWWYLLAGFLFPPFIFVFSTMFDAWQFHHRKKRLLLWCLMADIFQAGTIFFRVISRLFLPVIFQINPGRTFTKQMVMLVGRIFVEIPVFLFTLWLARWIYKIFFEEHNLQKILSYRLSHHLEQKRNTYDLRIVKDIKSGRYVRVMEKDRYLHFLCDGSSGTGKTSAAILPAIRDDLDAHCRMEDAQLAVLKEMEEQGKICFMPSGRTPGILDFYPAVQKEAADTENIMKELKQLELRYPVAGITVLAPDDSLTDDVCRLCEARGVLYNRIDPARRPDGRKKKNCIGMNPFFMRKEMEGEARNQLIVKKAVIFSDVMQAITELKGKSDSYFSGVNRQMIANLAILAMLTIPVLHDRQATPSDLQEMINDFDKLVLPLKKLKELDRGINQFQFIIRYIESDLLGGGRAKMEDQSRGTRNIINEFLLMPYNREVFCSQESIDFDRILANGEVTVCNYNLAAGDTDATAFGLFFLLNFNNAVLSRPGTEHTRTPHFFYIDELPVLIHPSIEKNFSLFRKYRVAMFVAIQTLDQMEKNEITRYLKGVILGCAHILVFGRSSLTEMEIFSKFAGVKDRIEEEQGTTQSALTNADTRLTYTNRQSVKQKKVIEETDIRMRDFLEVTLFTTANGRPLEMVHGKVEFLKSVDWAYKPRKKYVFNRGDVFLKNTDLRESKKNPEESQKERLFAHDEIQNFLVKESRHIISSGQQLKEPVLKKNKEISISDQKECDAEEIEL